jgi:WD40 repeat protein
MVEKLPEGFIKRPQEFDALIKLLLDEKREEPVAITAALKGAGGYGKTTMARYLCHDERIQKAFNDGILWITLGENPGNLLGKLEDLIYILSHEHHNFNGMDTALARFAELLADQNILLVIDDVWNVAHLKPFLHGGPRCARLITTRNEGVLPRVAQRIEVDAMQPGQAVQLLLGDLSTTSNSAAEIRSLSELSASLGEWPLLLTLVEKALRERVDRGQKLLDALTSIKKTLGERGVGIFDAQNAQERSQSVKKTLQVSFDLLSPDDYARYRELALFPEDVDIPLATLQQLWGATGALGELDTDDVCTRLYRFSLLLRFDRATQTIRLHDVMRTYLRSEVGAIELVSLCERFLNAYDCQRWAQLSLDEPYLWDHLAQHLVDARRGAELVTTVKDGKYLIVKVCVRNAYAVETDISSAIRIAPNDPILPQLKRCLGQVSHLLKQSLSFKGVAGVLHRVISSHDDLSDIRLSLEREISRPCLTSWHPLPSLNDRQLLRALHGHTDWTRGCAVSPDGESIVSASDDETLKIWDAHSGKERVTLVGHAGRVSGCAVSPDGESIVSASADKTLKIWDAQSGEVRVTLVGHTGGVRGCAVSPDGESIVSASDDKTLKIWDAHTGKERVTLVGHTGRVSGCAVSPDGESIVSASADGTLKIWDAQSGKERVTLVGHIGGVSGCAVSPDGESIVSASTDKTLKIWDAHSGKERVTLVGHTGRVSGCAVSPDGESIVSASADKTLKIWDAHTGEERVTLVGHTGRVSGCAVSPDGESIVSASADKTLKIWDAHSGETLVGHTGKVRGCAVSPDGESIVSASDDETLKIWDAHSGEVRETLVGHIDGVSGCAVSPDGESIVSASDDKTLKIWDAHTGEEQVTLVDHTGGVSGCAVSPDGESIVSASADYTLKIWDAHTGEEQMTLIGHIGGVSGCAVSPDGQSIISASADKTLKIWDAHSGKERVTLAGHTGGVSGCAVSPDGEFIVSASADGTLKIWDAHTGICHDTLFADGYLYGCAFCPDGSHLVAGGEQGIFFLQLLR